MIWGTDDLVRTSLFPGSRPLEWNTIFIIAVRINLRRAAIENVEGAQIETVSGEGETGEYEVIKLVPSSWRFVNNCWSTTLLLFGGKWHWGSRNTPTLAASGRESCPVFEHTHTCIWLSQRVTQTNTHTQDLSPFTSFHKRFVSTLYELCEEHYDFFIKGELQINTTWLEVLYFCLSFLSVIITLYTLNWDTAASLKRNMMRQETCSLMIRQV